MSWVTAFYGVDLYLSWVLFVCLFFFFLGVEISAHAWVSLHNLKNKKNNNNDKWWTDGQILAYRQSYPWIRKCCRRRESAMPTASKAFQALVHSVKANPVFLKLSQDSKTKLLTPNLHIYMLTKASICNHK